APRRTAPSARAGGLAALALERRSAGRSRAARDAEVGAQAAVARLHVTQEDLGLLLQHGAEAPQAAADRLGVAQGLVGRLLRGLEPLRGLLAGLLGDLHRLDPRVVARLVGVALRVGAEAVAFLLELAAALGQLALG